MRSLSDSDLVEALNKLDKHVISVPKEILVASIEALKTTKHKKKPIIERLAGVSSERLAAALQAHGGDPMLPHHAQRVFNVRGGDGERYYESPEGSELVPAVFEIIRLAFMVLVNEARHVAADPSAPAPATAVSKN